MARMWSTLSLAVLVVLQVHCQKIYLEDGFDGRECPIQCQCFFINDRTDCAGKNLTELPTPINSEVEVLDLSHNLLEEIPDGLTNFPEITHLYLKDNRIKYINAYNLNISTLQYLDLSYNDLTWQDLQPDRFLAYATGIKELHLSLNSLQNINEDEYIVSKTLETLYVQKCSMEFIHRAFLKGLPQIKHISLSDNKLQKVPLLFSNSLASLDLSGNRIIDVPATILNELPFLKTLSLAFNHLRTFSLSRTASLETLDLSFCNLERFNLNKLVGLKFVSIRDNHIRIISKKDFTNKYLEYINLSRNSIHLIDHSAFKELPALSHLDLSMNSISHLGPDLFSNNPNLKILNLTRNYITVVSFHSKSLIQLDLSNCEIQDIDDSLVKFPSLLRLELSRNYIKSLPRVINVTNLEYLDVSMNKIADIKNTTLSGLVNLKVLNIEGNRLMGGLNPNHFPPNLVKVDLGDNLWICSCFSIDFRQFYSFLVNPPSKVKYKSKLVCHSPENVTGLPWDLACSYAWFDDGSDPKREKVWLYVTFVALAMTIILCSVVSIKKIYNKRLLNEQRQRELMAAEARERLRRIRIQQRLDAQQNAPDPRELVRPPPYAEAVLMPRIDASTTSLASRAVAGSQPNLNYNQINSTNNISSDIQPSEVPNGENARRKSKRSRTKSKTEAGTSAEAARPSRSNDDSEDEEGEATAKRMIAPKESFTESDL